MYFHAGFFFQRKRFFSHITYVLILSPPVHPVPYLLCTRTHTHTQRFLFFREGIWYRISLCSPSCPRAHHVDQGSLKHKHTEIHLPLPPSCWDLSLLFVKEWSCTVSRGKKEHCGSNLLPNWQAKAEHSISREGLRSRASLRVPSPGPLLLQTGNLSTWPLGWGFCL